MRKLIALVLASSLFVFSAFAVDATYDVAGDAVTLLPVEVVYVGTVAQQAAQAAADAGVIPLAESSWTTAQWSNVYNAILSINTPSWSANQWTNVYNAITSGDTDKKLIEIYNNMISPVSFTNLYNEVKAMSSALGSYSSMSVIQSLGYAGSYPGQSVARHLDSLLNLMRDLITSSSSTTSLASQSGFSLFDGKSQVSNQTFAEFIRQLSWMFYHNSVYGFLAADGSSTTGEGYHSLVWYVVNGLSGLASILRGSSNEEYTGSLWSISTELESSEYSIAGGFPMIHQLLDNMNAGVYSIADPRYFSSQSGFSIFNGTTQLSNQPFSEFVRQLSWVLYQDGRFGFLGPDGTSSNTAGYHPVVWYLNSGILGIASIMRGSSNDAYKGSLWSFDDNGDLTSQSYSVSGGFPMINTLLDNMNGGLYRLVNVLASPLDEKISDAARKDQEAFNENFQGDGAGSSGDSVGSAAGISSGFSDTFSTGANPGQFFSGINDNIGIWFSQEMLDAMTYSGPQAMAFDDDEEWISLYDDSREQFYSLLGGG